MRLRFRVSYVNSEDKSRFSAFQAILFTCVQFQPATYTRFNKSGAAFVKNGGKITLPYFTSLSPLCPFFTELLKNCFAYDLAKLVRGFYLSPNLPFNYPQSGAVHERHSTC